MGIAALSAGTPALAQSWSDRGTTSGFFVSGTPTGMYFRCAGGDVTVNFSGFAARLSDAATFRVGVSVDGTAWLLTATAATVSGGTVLVHRAALDTLRPMIEALRQGRKAEISTPAGRYDLPLNGSGAALGQLLARCG